MAGMKQHMPGMLTALVQNEWIVFERAVQYSNTFQTSEGLSQEWEGLGKRSKPRPLRRSLPQAPTNWTPWRCSHVSGMWSAGRR